MNWKMLQNSAMLEKLATGFSFWSKLSVVCSASDSSPKIQNVYLPLSFTYDILIIKLGSDLKNVFNMMRVYQPFELAIKCQLLADIKK